MDACGTRAYVVLRKEQKVVELLDIDTATPVVGASVAVGSEPTGIAITPNNTKVFATNWVDGTATAIDALTMAVTSTIDLNAPLAATGLLGPAVMGNARPGLAHPRFHRDHQQRRRERRRRVCLRDGVFRAAHRPRRARGRHD